MLFEFEVLDFASFMDDDADGEGDADADGEGDADADDENDEEMNGDESPTDGDE